MFNWGSLHLFPLVVVQSLSDDCLFGTNLYDCSRISLSIITLTFFSLVLFGSILTLWAIQSLGPDDPGSVRIGLTVVEWASGWTSFWLATPQENPQNKLRWAQKLTEIEPIKGGLHGTDPGTQWQYVVDCLPVRLLTVESRALLLFAGFWDPVPHIVLLCPDLIQCEVFSLTTTWNARFCGCPWKAFIFLNKNWRGVLGAQRRCREMD